MLSAYLLLPFRVRDVLRRYLEAPSVCSSICPSELPVEFSFVSVCCIMVRQSKVLDDIERSRCRMSVIVTLVLKG